MSSSRLLLAAAAAAALACERIPSDVLTRCETSRVIAAPVKTDILFVIDDSQSMLEEQENLRSNLATFVMALAASPAGDDYQVGVTTTSVSGPGTPDPQAYASGVPYPSGALVAMRATGTAGDIDWSAQTGFGGARILASGSATLVQDFQRNVRVGTGGSYKEQPFLAARKAIEAATPDGVNAGFLRPGARLAVVFLSDEDDCSDSAEPYVAYGTCSSSAVKNADPPQIDPVEGFAAFLAGDLQGERRDVFVAAIAGVDPASLAPSCGTSGGVDCANKSCGTAWDGGDRFVALAAAIGSARSRVGSICSASFAPILQDIAGLLVSQSVTLDAVPADWRMLVAGIERDGQTIPCPIELDATPEAATADAVYKPLEGSRATLTFQGACQLQQGDNLKIDVICAG